MKSFGAVVRTRDQAPVVQTVYNPITDAFDKHLRIKINDKNFE